MKVHDKGNYTVNDKNRHQLATKVYASNLKLWQELIASDFLPDWIKPSLIPDTVSEFKEQLDDTKKQKQNKQKKAQEKTVKPNEYLKKLYGHNFPPPPCEQQDPVEHITPNVFKDEMEESMKKNMKEKKSTLLTTFLSTLFHKTLITLKKLMKQSLLPQNLFGD